MQKLIPQTFINELWLKHSIKQILTDQYLQTWLSSVNDSPKALNYRIYKDNLVFENYLNILNDKDNLTLSKFRTTNHKLPVENGRWKNIARENRICPLNVIMEKLEMNFIIYLNVSISAIKEKFI